MPTLFTIIVYFLPTIFVIRIGINFFLFSKFLHGMLRSMPHAKYKVEHNHAAE